MISIGNSQDAAIRSDGGPPFNFSKPDPQENCCSDVRIATSPEPSKFVLEDKLIPDSQQHPEIPKQSTSVAHSTVGSTPSNTSPADLMSKKFQDSYAEPKSSLQIQSKKTTKNILRPQLVPTSIPGKSSDEILQEPTNNEAFGRVSQEAIRKTLPAPSADASQTQLHVPSETTSQNPLQLNPYRDLQPTSSSVYQSTSLNASEGASDEHLHSWSPYVSQEPMMSESAVAHALPYKVTQVTVDDTSQTASEGSSDVISGTSQTSLDVTSNVVLGISQMGEVFQVAAGNISQDTTGNVSQATTASIYPVESYFPMIEPKNCLEALAVGYNVSGVYTIRPYDCCPERRVKVFCDMATEGGGWTVIQRRDQYQTQENFYRTWEEYVSGFGNLTQEFWLGLEHIHALSNQSVYEARFDLGDFEGQTRFAKYDIFTVGNADRFYQLDLGSYSGNAEDSMAYHRRKKFTTKDKDNDESIGNCAVMFVGGWWYGDCHHANLNGEYLLGPSGWRGIIWLNWRGFSYSLKWTEIKIRPTIFM
ncbi:tenascin-like isoform X2 [Penaeus chinensis]|nr:tenascin-like isoform X2 [Penaeus chinensis]